VQSKTVEVDPVWWLTRYVYPSDGENPFKAPGYYHAMSYYGDLPGSSYGVLHAASSRLVSEAGMLRRRTERAARLDRAGLSVRLS